MKMDEEKDWSADDATWKLLGEANPRRGGGRFAEDTVRAVKLLPESDPWWPNVSSFSPWLAAAACGVIAAIMFFGQPGKVSGESDPVVSLESGENWVAISEVAEAEMLAAAADDLDSFSDQELVSLIGF